MKSLALLLVVSAALCPSAGAKPPSGEKSQRPACPNSDPDGIRRSFGRIWHVPEERGIAFDESKDIARMLVRYYACAAYQDESLQTCDQIKPIVMGPGFGVSDCRSAAEKTAFVGLVESLAGRGGGRALSCPSYYQVAMQDSGLAESAWCQAVAAAKAKGGLGPLCSESARLNPQITGFLPECRKKYPVQPADCGADAECKNRLAVYRAVSSGNYKQCPPDYRASCEIVAAKGDACAKATDNLRSTYCALYETASARLHGQIGLTDEAMSEIHQINRGIRKGKGDEEPEEPEAPAGGRGR